MKYKIKYRVVSADRSKRKYAINLDEGASFQLSRELLLPEGQRGSGTTLLCKFTVHEAALYVFAVSREFEPVVNGKKGSEFAVRPGDVLQIDEFTIEFLEAPHQVKAQAENETQFLDVGDIVPAAAAAVAARAAAPALVVHAPAPPSRPAPAPPMAHRPKPAPAPAKAESPAPAPRQSGSGFWSFAEVQIALSVGMALLASALIARILISVRGYDSDAMVYFVIGAPALILLALGCYYAGSFLSVRASFRDYCRFFAFASLVAVPWAYSAGFQPVIAIFSWIILASLLLVGFLVRFRPAMSRFAGVSGGLLTAVVAFGVVVTQHSGGTADRAPAEVSVPPTTPMNTVDGDPARTPAAAPAPVQPAAPVAAPAPAPAQPVAAAPVAPAVAPASVPALAPAVVAKVEKAKQPEVQIADPLANEQFFMAVRSGNLDVVRSLIEKRAVHPDFTLDKGSTPLMVASANGRLSVAKYLLTKRVNINAQDPSGTTALMWAVFKGHREVAKLLIEKGAKRDIRRDDGDRALDIARKWKQGEIARLLEAAPSTRMPASTSSKKKTQTKSSAKTSKSSTSHKRKKHK